MRKSLRGGAQQLKLRPRSRDRAIRVGASHGRAFGSNASASSADSLQLAAALIAADHDPTTLELSVSTPAYRPLHGARDSR